MILIYGVALPLLAIVFLPVILVAFIIQPKFHAGFWQKIGVYSQNNSGKKTVLVHAVSVGEVNAVENLVKRMRKEFPDDYIILSTVTKTGQGVAQNKLSDYTDKIIYFPYDFFFSVFSCLKALKPDEVIIAETEIWPMFLYISNFLKIPVLLINGRISPSSYNSYRYLKFFFKNVLNKFDKIYMQTEGDKERIINIGAPAEKTFVMGNLKFDINKNLSESNVKELRSQMKLGENRLFVAASTHKGEDEVALSVFRNIKAQNPDAKLLIVPRHPQRYEQVEELLRAEKYQYSKRSLGGNFETNDIIMLDTMGELAKFFSLAYVAFIGGSFTNTGGHNPLEANIWDVPVVSGPTVFNFKDIYKLLTREGVAQIVLTEDEFIAAVNKFYSSKEFHDRVSADCKRIFDNSRGALDFVIEQLRNEN